MWWKTMDQNVYLFADVRKFWKVPIWGWKPRFLNFWMPFWVLAPNLYDSEVFVYFWFHWDDNIYQMKIGRLQQNGGSMYFFLFYADMGCGCLATFPAGFFHCHKSITTLFIRIWALVSCSRPIDTFLGFGNNIWVPSHFLVPLARSHANLTRELKSTDFILTLLTTCEWD